MDDNTLKDKLNAYRKDNMMLRDRIAHLKTVIIKELKDEITKLKEEIDKKDKEKSYWEHKHNKKGSWFW